MWSVAVSQNMLSKRDICPQCRLKRVLIIPRVNANVSIVFRGRTTISVLRASKVMAADYHTGEVGPSARAKTVLKCSPNTTISCSSLIV